MEAAAFFGLGQMGQAMALRLLESGYPVGVNNRTREKTTVEMSLSVTLPSGLFIP